MFQNTETAEVRMARPAVQPVSRRRATVELVVIGGLALVAMLALSLAARYGLVTDYRWLNVVGVAIVDTTLIVVMVLICRAGKSASDVFPAIGWTLKRWRGDLLIGLGAFAGIALLGVAAMVAVALLQPEALETLEKNRQSVETQIPRFHPIGLVAMTVVVAFVEETLFRGFLLTRLHAVLPWWPAVVVIGSGLFAAMHGYQTGVGVAAVFLVGLLLSGLFLWRRSLVPGIVLHFCINAVQLVANYAVSESWK